MNVRKTQYRNICDGKVTSQEKKLTNMFFGGILFSIFYFFFHYFFVFIIQCQFPYRNKYTKTKLL